MKKLLLLLILFPLIVHAGINAGFVKGIWYSQTPFFNGDQVRIYSAIQNHSKFDIQGKAQFYVNNQVIGTSVFSAVKGRLIEVWADWTAIQGSNKVEVRITEAFKSEPGQEPQPITLENLSFEENIFVDIDTDNDGIGNEQDIDDDNDGILDEQEISLGSDPLVQDTVENNTVVNNTDEETYSTSTKIIKGAYETVKDVVQPVIKGINSFADKQKENIDNRKHVLRLEIEQGDKKLLKQSELIFFSIISFILGFKPLFYLCLLVFIYLIFKVIFKLVKK